MLRITFLSISFSVAWFMILPNFCLNQFEFTYNLIIIVYFFSTEFVNIEARLAAAQNEINEVRNQENPAQDHNIDDHNELRELVNQNEQMELDNNNEVIENNNEVMDLADRFVQLENRSQDGNRVDQGDKNKQIE